ncbi:MAG: ORF6N domain-containing protein [Muribaculaceae bacterium]|nr:ORF6N domain-containing protein [Muribaculaceae bacterium]
MLIYGVETRVLNQAVKRNIERFPEDFMFQLTKDEAENLRLQIATSNSRSQNVILKDNLGNLKSQNLTSGSRSQFATLKQGHNIKYRPYAFTENGVAMLSSVLKSFKSKHTLKYWIRCH